MCASSPKIEDSSWTQCLMFCFDCIVNGGLFEIVAQLFAFSSPGAMALPPLKVLLPRFHDSLSFS